MNITCAQCNTRYNLTDAQIDALPEQTLNCIVCRKNIKIVRCGQCNATYSISYSSINREMYELKCERCGALFKIDFSSRHTGDSARDGARPSVSIEKERILADALPKDAAERKKLEKIEKEQTAKSFGLADLLKLCMDSFQIMNFRVALLGTIVLYVLIWLYDVGSSFMLSRMLRETGSYLHTIFPIGKVVLALFAYSLPACVIARNVFNTYAQETPLSFRMTVEKIVSSIPTLALSNGLLLIVCAGIVFILAKIPVVGPILFSLVLLPAYIISLCVILFTIIGFWFYPSIVVSRSDTKTVHIIPFLTFVRKYNFSLIFIIPVMFLLTALVFSIIAGLHYAALSLTIFIARIGSATELIRVFSSVPSSLVRISDMSLFGADSGLFKNYISNLLFSHDIAGVITGIVLLVLSSFLMAAFISLNSTVSAHFFIRMEKNIDIDDNARLRMLTILSLILLVIFLIRKLFL